MKSWLTWWISICLLPENPEVCSVVTVGSSREARRSGMAATWLGGRGPLRWPTPCALLLRPSAANATTPTARSINHHPVTQSSSIQEETEGKEGVCVSWYTKPGFIFCLFLYNKWHASNAKRVEAYLGLLVGFQAN